MASVFNGLNEKIDADFVGKAIKNLKLQITSLLEQ